MPTGLGDFAEWTRRAARARSRTMDPVVAALAAIDPGDVEGSLRRGVESSAPADFELLASIAAGAYTMHPDVMAAVGYPEPRRAPVPFDQSLRSCPPGSSTRCSGSAGRCCGRRRTDRPAGPAITADAGLTPVRHHSAQGNGIVTGLAPSGPSGSMQRIVDNRRLSDA